MPLSRQSCRHQAIVNIGKNSVSYCADVSQCVTEIAVPSFKLTARISRMRLAMATGQIMRSMVAIQLHKDEKHYQS